MQLVFQALNAHAAARPDVAAFEDDIAAITWSDLSMRVADLAARLDGAPRTIGIGLAGGIDYVVADLAITLAGRRQVPLPFFFSAGQIAHVLADAGVGAVVTTNPAQFAALPQVTTIDPTPSGTPPRALPDYAGGAERVIYTSGSSGAPKGVIIGDRQLNASLSALSAVIAATPEDRHLSILPLAQLLEQICGIFLPILAGAHTVFRFAATKALFGGPITPLTQAFASQSPTTSLLAPALLGRWVADLAAQDRKAPDNLRFVAVGGASSPPALIESARALNIPCFEGYGLSECCAVVAMNHPDQYRTGTVGPVLDGLDVTLENGEITVTAPTVMVGYLHGDPAPVTWKTGDLGHFDGNFLVVDGRKDALLVTGAGRNISPEWVEQRVNADPRIVSSALGLRDSDGQLVLVVVAMAPVSLAEISQYLDDLPDYARPAWVILTDPAEPGLLFPAGTPNRATARTLINSRDATRLSPTPERLVS